MSYFPAQFSGNTKAGLSTARPTASGSGRIYYCTDIPVGYIDDPTSGAWIPFFAESYESPLAVGSYTTGTFMTLTQRADAILATISSDANSVGNCALTAGSLPSTGSSWIVELTAKFFNPQMRQYGAIFCIVANGTTTGTSNAWGASFYGQNNDTCPGQGGTQFAVNGLRVTSFMVNNSSQAFSRAGGLVRIRILNDGVNLHYQYSEEGAGFWDDMFVANGVPAALTHYGFAIGNDAATGNNFCAALILRNKLKTLTVPQASITGITVALNPTVTATSHGFRDGDMIAIHGVTGTMAASVNSGNGISWNSGATYIRYIDANSFSLPGVTSTGVFGAGGLATLTSR